MKVREFSENDRAVFYQMCQDFYQSGATLRGYDKSLAKATFDRVMDHHENLWGFMMEDKDYGDDIGYALLTSYWCNEEGGNVLILDELYIVPNNRKKGYASLFMDWVETHFREKAVSVTLEVLTSNQAAQLLYEKEGYVSDGFTTMTKRIAK